MRDYDDESNSQRAPVIKALHEAKYPLMQRMKALTPKELPLWAYYLLAVSLCVLGYQAVADHGEIDCGWYGPHRAQIECPDPKHAHCWADLQGLGYCKAKCTCDAAPNPAATPPQALLVTTGFNYGVSGGIASWRPCGSDNLVSLPSSRIASAIAGGNCGGLALPIGTRYTISIKPP